MNGTPHIGEDSLGSIADGLGIVGLKGASSGCKKAAVYIPGCNEIIAGEHVYKSGTIRITAQAIEGQRIAITVADDGLGLSPDDLAEVRRFLPGGTSKTGSGTGFGLPTARRMVEAHGGSLEIESQEGEGTTVTIALPNAAGGDGR